MRRLDSMQELNAYKIFDALSHSTIDNTDLWIAIVCVAAKESGLRPSVENSYEYTDNDRIRKIFGKKKLGPYYFDSDEALSKLKKNPQKFFSVVYALVAGNGPVESFDGWKYRGRGLNQITGLSNYKKMQKATGWELERRPGMLLYAKCAADCLVAFYERAFKTVARKKIEKYFDCEIENLQIDTAIAAMAWINAGIGKKPCGKVVTEAYQNSRGWLPDVKELFEEWKTLP